MQESRFFELTNSSSDAADLQVLHTENGMQSPASLLSPPSKRFKFLQNKLSSAVPNLQNSGPECELETSIKTFKTLNISIASTSSPHPKSAYLLRNHLS